jgi:DNA-binding SARP family transcriptional activator
MHFEIGHCAKITGLLHLLVEEYPRREAFYYYLMAALCRAGRQPDALRVYHKAQTVIAEELNVDPGQPLRDLFQGILKGDGANEDYGRSGTVASSRTPNLAAYARKLHAS